MREPNRKQSCRRTWENQIESSLAEEHGRTKYRAVLQIDTREPNREQYYTRDRIESSIT